MTSAIEAKRARLERQRGQQYLTVTEAAEALEVSPQAIYISKELYDVEEYEGTYFVPLTAAYPGIEPIPIRGVEYQEQVGRVNVTRYLCLPCRLYFRTKKTAATHPCFQVEP